MNDYLFDFHYYFWLKIVYIFNLSQFISCCQFVDGKSLDTVKNQALIGSYSMIG